LSGKSLIFGERRLKSEDNTSSNLVSVAKGEHYMKKNHETDLRCKKCEKHGLVKYNSHDGAML